MNHLQPPAGSPSGKESGRNTSKFGSVASNHRPGPPHPATVKAAAQWPTRASAVADGCPWAMQLKIVLRPAFRGFLRPQKRWCMPCALALRPRCRRVFAGCPVCEGRMPPHAPTDPAAPVTPSTVPPPQAVPIGAVRCRRHCRARRRTWRWRRRLRLVPSTTPVRARRQPRSRLYDLRAPDWPTDANADPASGVAGPQTLAQQTAANRTAAPAPTPAAAPPAAPATPPAAAPAAAEGIRTASSDAIHGRDGDSTGFALRHIPTPALANDPVRLLATSRSA